MTFSPKDASLTLNDMKYIKYVRKENNSYYRRKRAVASHTRWGENNPNALSSYLIGEKEMTAEERKSAELPCGYTIAESWAALRKCWLGFNITKDQGDRDGMEEFAYRIRRIQAEMGIKPTNFDSDILDENTVNRIDSLYRKTLPPFNEAVENSEQQTNESNELDYGRIMDGSNCNSQSIPAPRQEIFTTHKQTSRSSNSCPSPSPAYQPKADVKVQVKDYENSCYFGPPKQVEQSQEHIKEIKTIYKKQRHAPPMNLDNFAVSGPENTLGVPNPDQPPIQPILRKQSCTYSPAKDPPHVIHKDKSCEYDPPQSQLERSEKEKDIQTKSKSCHYKSEF